MFSQDSIRQIEEAADLEAKEERHKLDDKERQKREFAKMLKLKQDLEFKQKQDQTTQERLKYLLKKSELITHFILSQKGKNASNIASSGLTGAPHNQNQSDRLDEFKQKLGGSSFQGKP